MTSKLYTSVLEESGVSYQLGAMAGPVFWAPPPCLCLRSEPALLLKFAANPNMES